MEIENIPDSASLYRRVYTRHFNRRKNRFSDAAFMVRSNEKYLSVNWGEYISPEEAVIAPNTEKEFYLGELKASTPREIELDVIHRPSLKQPDTPHSKSHSSIIGDKLLDQELAYEAAGYLADNCEPIII